MSPWQFDTQRTANGKKHGGPGTGRASVRSTLSRSATCTDLEPVETTERRPSAGHDTRPDPGVAPIVIGERVGLLVEAHGGDPAHEDDMVSPRIKGVLLALQAGGGPG